MAGSRLQAWPHVKEIFQSISAKVNDEPCCDWVGESGAGHYVKMVHNGIEYGDMQIICEAYMLMKNTLGILDFDFGLTLTIFLWWAVHVMTPASRCALSWYSSCDVGIAAHRCIIAATPYHVLLSGMSCDEMSKVFGEWNKGELDSFLIEITTNILAYKVGFPPMSHEPDPSSPSPSHPLQS